MMTRAAAAAVGPAAAYARYGVHLTGAIFDDGTTDGISLLLLIFMSVTSALLAGAYRAARRNVSGGYFSIAQSRWQHTFEAATIAGGGSMPGSGNVVSVHSRTTVGGGSLEHRLRGCTVRCARSAWRRMERFETDGRRHHLHRRRRLLLSNTARGAGHAYRQRRRRPDTASGERFASSRRGRHR